MWQKRWDNRFQFYHSHTHSYSHTSIVPPRNCFQFLYGHPCIRHLQAITQFPLCRKLIEKRHDSNCSFHRSQTLTLYHIESQCVFFLFLFLERMSTEHWALSSETENYFIGFHSFVFALCIFGLACEWRKLLCFSIRLCDIHKTCHCKWHFALNWPTFALLFHFSSSRI